MTDIHLTLKNSLKEALKAKDTVRLNVIRALLTSFVNELVSNNQTPQDILSDDMANRVILRTIKQREDAIKQFESAGRQDLADEDKAQLLILQEYGPVMVSFDEIKKVVQRLKDENNFTDKSSLGKLIGLAKKELGDNADGNIIKDVVNEIFV